jgi:hypothetical protein
MKIACVYDTNTPYTTGVYFERAFKELGMVVDRFHHDNVNQIPEGYSIYFICDSGPIYQIPKWKSGISMYYGIDVHLDFDHRFEMAKSADVAAMAQMSCGAQKATNLNFPIFWMPLGCDPWVHQDHQLERELDIAFVGHLYEDDSWRTTIKQKLIDHGFNEGKIFVGEATKEDMAIIYSRAKIVINASVRNNRQDISMRSFEAMSCGAYLLTQKLDNDDMNKIIDSELYGTFVDDNEMFGKIDTILKDWNTFSSIAQKGKIFVRTYHTYKIHLQAFLKVLSSPQEKE